MSLTALNGQDMPFLENPATRFSDLHKPVQEA
jgi:hypothetical protein